MTKIELLELTSQDFMIELIISLPFSSQSEEKRIFCTKCKCMTHLLYICFYASDDRYSRDRRDRDRRDRERRERERDREEGEKNSVIESKDKEREQAAIKVRERERERERKREREKESVRERKRKV